MVILTLCVNSTTFLDHVPPPIKTIGSCYHQCMGEYPNIDIKERPIIKLLTIKRAKGQKLKEKKTKISLNLYPNKHIGCTGKGCTEVSAMDDQPKYIEEVSYRNGFKVISNTPVLSEQEYLQREQVAVANIINCILKDQSD